MLEIKEIAINEVVGLTKNEVIELIFLMNKFNQREQAEVTYLRENARHPEWNLFSAYRAALAVQA